MTAWIVSGLLFLIGLAAVVLRRQLLAMFLGLELMILAGCLGIIHQAGRTGQAEGFVAALLILAVSAADAVVGLSLILRIHGSGREPETEALRQLRG